MALTKNGFTRETYETVLRRMETKAREVFGGNVNTSQRSVLGMILRVVAYPMALLWQDAEDIYHSGFRDTAEGTALDAHAAMFGTTRLPASQAWGYVYVLPRDDMRFTLPRGTIFVKEDDTRYYTADDVWVDGRTTVEVIAEEPGSVGNANKNEIIGLLNPDARVFGVANDPIENGEEIESDASLRRRLDVIVQAVGGSTAKAIEARLLAVGGVRYAFVDENYEGTSIYGTPLGALQAFVIGGEDRDVAQVINNQRAAGINPYGTETVSIDGKEVSFSRPRTATLRITLNIETDATFTDASRVEVRRRVFEAFGGYDDIENIVYDSPLRMGEGVKRARLIGIAMSVQGVTDASTVIILNNQLVLSTNANVAPDEIIDVTRVDVVVR